MNENNKTENAPNKYLINAALILSAFSFVALMIAKDFLPIIFLIPSIIYLHQYKSKTKKEENRRNNLSFKSHSIALLLPSGIILIVLLYLFFWKLFPTIMRNWPV